MLPIVDLARWAGHGGRGDVELDARAPAGGARRRACSPTTTGACSRRRSRSSCALRLDHQVEQVREPGTPPDDFLHPGRLTPLTRSYLKDAFRAVAAVQRRIGAELLYDIA